MNHEVVNAILIQLTNDRVEILAPKIIAMSYHNKYLIETQWLSDLCYEQLGIPLVDRLRILNFITSVTTAG